MQLDQESDADSIDETAADFSDNDDAPQKVLKNRLGLPVAIPKKSALQLRLAQMERDREDAKERIENDKAEQAAKQAEHDDAMATMCSQLEVLQATMLTLQDDSNRKFAEMQQHQQQQQIQQQQQQIASDKKFADMQSLMMKFFEKVEKKQQQPQLQVHGKGSSKAGAPQQKREADVEVTECDEDGRPEKLKVPFDSINESAAAAAASC
jgi:hypothetical protein